MQASQKHDDGPAVILVKTSHLYMIIHDKPLFGSKHLIFDDSHTHNHTLICTKHHPSFPLCSDITFGVKEVEMSLCRVARVRDEHVEGTSQVFTTDSL